MASPLRVLSVEDCEDDAILVMRQLRRGGYDATFKRVETPEDFSAALEAEAWDIVIADYTLPRFSAPAALAIWKDRGLDVPFIIVSGQVGEERAVAKMRSGAHDFLTKDNLARLAPVVERELREAEMRQKHRQAQEALQESEEMYRGLFDSSLDGIVFTDLEGKIRDANRAYLDMLGYSSEEIRARTYQQLTPPKWREAEQDVVESQVMARGYSDEYEKEYISRDGTTFPVSVRAWLIRDKEGRATGMWGIVRDITERKRAERALREGEARYRSLFENSPIPLREEDLSGVKTYIQTLQDSGMSSIERFLDEHPEAIAKCAAMISIVNANRATLELYAVASKEELQARFHTTFGAGAYDAFKLELIAIAHGKTTFECETIVTSLAGEDRNVVLRWSVAPGYESTLARVWVSSIDLTERRRAQSALRNVEAEFDIARDIQDGLFPETSPSLPGFSIAGASHPAVATSGDYFDYITMLDGSLGVVIGDVTSHGLGPALLMSDTRACLRTLATICTDPGEILTRANRILSQDTRDGRFVTLFFARIDPNTRILHYASAGHEAYLLDGSGRHAMLESTTYPLGVAEDEIVPCAPPIQLEPGHIMVLLTDGILETESPDEDHFGPQRSLDIVRANRDRPAEEVVRAICTAAHEFRGGLPQLDDLTAVIVRIDSAPEANA